MPLWRATAQYSFKRTATVPSNLLYLLGLDDTASARRRIIALGAVHVPAYWCDSNPGVSFPSSLHLHVTPTRISASSHD